MMAKIIGLGNRLRGDDAIGPIVIEEIENLEAGRYLQLIDAGADSFTVLEHLLDEEPLVIVDCARMGKSAGEIAVFNGDEDKFNISENAISLHGFSLAETISIAKGTGEPMAEYTIIGIEPESIEFNEPLSTTLKNSLTGIVSTVLMEAKKYE